MPFGIQNATTINMSDIEQIANVTDIPGLMINVNHIIYDGWLYFFLLLVLWVIFYIAANKVRDQPLINVMYAGAIISIISFFLRAIEVVRGGVVYGLLTDFQMWIFPLVTIIVATVVWAIKD